MFLGVFEKYKKDSLIVYSGRQGEILNEGYGSFQAPKVITLAVKLL